MSRGGSFLSKMSFGGSRPHIDSMNTVATRNTDLMEPFSPDSGNVAEAETKEKALEYYNSTDNADQLEKMGGPTPYIPVKKPFRNVQKRKEEFSLTSKKSKLILGGIILVVLLIVIIAIAGGGGDENENEENDGNVENDDNAGNDNEDNGEGEAIEFVPPFNATRVFEALCSATEGNEGEDQDFFTCLDDNTFLLCERSSFSLNSCPNDRFCQCGAQKVFDGDKEGDACKNANTECDRDVLDVEDLLAPRD